MKIGDCFTRNECRLPECFASLKASMLIYVQTAKGLSFCCCRIIHKFRLFLSTESMLEHIKTAALRCTSLADQSSSAHQVQILAERCKSLVQGVSIWWQPVWETMTNLQQHRKRRSKPTVTLFQRHASWVMASQTGLRDYIGPVLAKLLPSKVYMQKLRVGQLNVHVRIRPWWSMDPFQARMGPTWDLVGSQHMHALTFGVSPLKYSSIRVRTRWKLPKLFPDASSRLLNRVPRHARPRNQLTSYVPVEAQSRLSAMRVPTRNL